jgi:hypothetical protein
LTIRHKEFSTDLLTEMTQIWGLEFLGGMILPAVWELLFYQGLQKASP